MKRYLEELLANLSIIVAISIASVLPIILAITLAGGVAVSKLSIVQEMKQLQYLVIASAVLSDLVHEQQKERGMTAIYLGSDNPLFIKELTVQRGVTDKQRLRVNEQIENLDQGTVPAEFANLIRVISQKLSEMDGIRNKIDSRQISSADAIAYYTNLNSEILDSIQLIANISENGTITTAVMSFVNFLQAKERSGIERAIGSAGFGRGSFTDKAMAKFQSLITEQNVYQESFLTIASDSQSEEFENIMISDAAKAVQAMREIAFSAGAEGNLQEISAADFFNAQTEKINQMKTLENRLSADLLATMQGLRDRSFFDLSMVIALALLAIILVVTTSVMLIRAIKSGFGGIVVAANQLAEGNIDVTIPPATHNEIGQIAIALAAFVENFRKTRDLEQNLQEQREMEAARKEKRERETREHAADEQARKLNAQEEIIAAERKATVEISEVVSACAGGNFSGRLSTEDKHGVIAELCNGINHIGEVTNGSLQEVERALVQLSEGNLSNRMNGEFQGIFAEIHKKMNATSEGLINLIRQIRESSDVIGESTDAVAEASEDLAMRTQGNAATLEETAAAIAQLSASVESTAQAANATDNVINEIRAQASEGDTVVDQAVAAMSKIQKSSAEIEKITDVIDDIAFQTNLLSLNASIEAACAGDAGYGFAVVASEVRALAKRASEATNEISELIEVSGKQVNEGVALVGDTGKVFKSISNQITGVSTQVKDIVAAANEQSITVREIDSAATKLDHATQQNAAMFEETSASTLTLRSEAETLSKLISAFNLEEAPGEEVIDFPTAYGSPTPSVN